ncbi:MAG: hypothetical protein R3B09_09980 [Nannocystaceae bacterium]
MLDNAENVMTELSLVTTAALNITALNTATRCILAYDVDPAAGTTARLRGDDVAGRCRGHR